MSQDHKVQNAFQLKAIEWSAWVCALSSARHLVLDGVYYSRWSLTQNSTYWCCSCKPLKRHWQNAVLVKLIDKTNCSRDAINMNNTRNSTGHNGSVLRTHWQDSVCIQFSLVYSTHQRTSVSPFTNNLKSVCSWLTYCFVNTFFAMFRLKSFF